MNQTLKHDVRTTRTVLPQLRVCLPAVLESLGPIRVHVESFLAAQVKSTHPNFPMEEVMLAVQEACANVVRHAYRGFAVPGRIEVAAEVSPSLLRIKVIDEGSGYDPKTIPEPNFTKPKDGGYGMFLMREIMSKVSYRRTDSQNRLLLEKVIEDGEPTS